MKIQAMIMAAGLGTRLKPWTEYHPKALVPVEGVPALERLINKMKGEGVSKIYVNTHHFSHQVQDFLSSKEWGIPIIISDETDKLLDTGGGLAKVASMISPDDGPLLVHNVDILSNQKLTELIRVHEKMQNDITLLTSPRESSRKLLFDSERTLCGWHNSITNEYRPACFQPHEGITEEAFSGIYVIDNRGLTDLLRFSYDLNLDKFPIMDYLLSLPGGIAIRGGQNPELRLLDIGKPEALSRACDYI